MKKKHWGLIIVCLLIVSLLVSGCGGNSTEKLTPEEIAEKIITTYSETKTYKMDLNINQEMAMNSSGENVTFGIETIGNGAVDLAKKSMFISMDMKMNVLEGPEEMKQLFAQQGAMNTSLYFMNNTMYMYIDALGAWMKQELTEDLANMMWNQQDQMSQQIELLKEAEIEVLKEEAVDNIPCYVVSVKVDPEKLLAQIEPQMKQAIQASGAEAIDMDDFNIEKYDYTYWVDKETFFIRQCTFDATIDFPMTITNEAGEEETLDNQMKMTGTVKYYDLNTDVNITLPAEAENAQAMPFAE